MGIGYAIGAVLVFLIIILVFVMSPYPFATLSTAESVGSIKAISISDTDFTMTIVDNPLQTGQLSGLSTIGACLDCVNGHEVLLTPSEWQQYAQWWPGMGVRSTSINGVDYRVITDLPQITSDMTVTSDITISLSPNWFDCVYTCPPQQPTSINIGDYGVSFPITMRCTSSCDGKQYDIPGYYSLSGTVTISKVAPGPGGYCGDGVCQWPESNSDCPGDCPPGPSPGPSPQPQGPLEQLWNIIAGFFNWLAGLFSGLFGGG